MSARSASSLRWTRTPRRALSAAALATIGIGGGWIARGPVATALEPSPWLWGRLQRGPHAVGVEVVSGVDSSRLEGDSGTTRHPRPLELLVWYPAQSRGLTRAPVSFATYVDLSDGSMLSGLPGRPHDWRRRWLAESLSREPGAVSRDLLDRVLASPMAAVPQAHAIAARVPAILWSTRHATPAAQSVLSEYLASHGYVVAWMHYAGADSLLPPYDNVSARQKTDILEAHVADMQWAIRRLATHGSVDSMRVAVAAWSYSGEPATVLAQRTPRLRLLLSLSSNVFVPTYRTIDLAASLDSQPLRTDVAMLEETGEIRGQRRDAPELLDRLPGKVYRVSFSSLAHGNFNVLEGMIPSLTRIAAVQPWSSAGPGAQAGYETVCRAVVALVDKTMNGAPGNADAWLPPDGRGAAGAGTISLVRHGPGRGISSTAGTGFADERVVLRTDGWRLVANYVRPSTRGPVPAVLMLNKANGDRRVYAALARELASRGVASLRLDMRGAGESTNRGTFVPGLPNVALDHDEHDVVEGLRWLRAQRVIDATRIAVVGASYSGESMAAAARAGATARAYVALSPGSLSMRTIDGMDASGATWWVLRSRNERFVRDVVDSVRARSRTARVSEVDGSAHASDMLMSRPDVAVEIADWLSARLRR